MIRPVRLGDKVSDGEMHVDTLDASIQKPGKVVYHDTLFQPKTERKLHTRASAPQIPADLFPVKSTYRVIVGHLMFSSLAERFFLVLIVFFAGLVVVSVALQDDLGDAKVYLLITQLVILILFLCELLLKLIALGFVLPT